MPTFSLEADEQHIIDSFLQENDRTVGIVGGSILEARLEEKLKSQLKAADNKDDQKILDDFFQGLGPLATFSAKIRLGYLMKLYSYTVYSELNAIKDIRNFFAHDRMPVGFDSPEISKFINKLKLIENHIRPISELDEQAERKAGILYTQNPAASYNTPKWRFISTFGMFTRVFSLRLGAALDPIWEVEPKP